MFAGYSRGKYGRRNGLANYLAACMNERCAVHVPGLAVLYLGISPPPDFSSSPDRYRRVGSPTILLEMQKMKHKRASQTQKNA